ncbi:MAG TPA: alpha-galactosidase [Actinomycetes bacterium]|nr:alpha-galactosidase [Actinomycetes bacterium]
MNEDVQPDTVHLRRAGTSVVLRLGPTELPCVLHWGPDLGELSATDLGAVAQALRPPYLDSAVSSQAALALLPQHSSGWIGRPGLLGSRAGRDWSVAFDAVTHEVHEAGSAEWTDGPAAAVRLRSVGTDRPGALTVTTELELLASGLLRVRAAVRNDGGQPYEVTSVDVALPVPAEAEELLDMAGRHTHERTPQRRPFGYGAWVRESWGGRPGLDSATMLCAGRPGFGFRSGRVWGVHLAYSGNQVLSAERSATGWRLLRGGELLLPGEVRLAPGETYQGPWLVASWGEGLDALAGRVHRHLRARPQHPRRPRPVLINTWEAVYFKHDVSRLLALAEVAAGIGVERFVLDDGWFRHRRSDHAGLGDWVVDEHVYPNGLGPVADRVHELGMEFGLWFEPEMVNLDSDLARAHPDWIFATNHGPGLPSRYQHVLDLGHPDAYAFVLERMAALVEQYDIAYIKWDHNRSLIDAGHQPDGTPGVRRQVGAVYALMAALKARHPGLEIESCAGGGGRIDLGIMDYADRIWPSDSIDSLERQRMMRWGSLILPPELVGTHVGSAPDHSTGRTHTLRLRAGTAIFGHLGIEWDLTRVPQDELAALARWVELHKQLRPLLHSGEVVHADQLDPALLLEGVVAQDGSDALYRLVAIDLGLTWPPGRITLPGLDPRRLYRVTQQPPGTSGSPPEHAPGWLVEGVTLPGSVLGTVGIQSPLLAAEDLLLIRAQAVSG